MAPCVGRGRTRGVPLRPALGPTCGTRSGTTVARPHRTRRAGAVTRRLLHVTPDAMRVLVGAGLALAALALLTIAAPEASASTAGAAMPWDAPLDNILSNFAGRTARALVVIAIVGCGLFWAFTRNEEGLKKLGQIAFGGAIALGAVTLVAALGFDAALV